MKKVKISKVLHLAADKYLWDGVGGIKFYGDEYSCIAVRLAVQQIRASNPEACVPTSDIFDGLTKMGVDCRSSWEFYFFKEGPERQGARYLWLKWAALMAEEQGV